MDGMGTISWWGFSPAVDLLDLYCPSIKDGNDSADINILLVGPADCRHVLKTLAHIYRHPELRQRKLNFYVTEPSVEQYARHMLLLALALEPQTRLGLQDKTEIFLELFGNSLVRLQSMQYVQRMAAQFIRMVTDSEELSCRLSLFDLSNLKFKELDLLEGVFKFWRNTKPSVFDIKLCWDLRLRQYLGVRYDAIPNVFDWDFHMKLCDKGAAIINSRNYTSWRHRGVAFEIREATYDTPNRTLGSIRLFQHAGDKTVRLGYWGDIVTSPYIAFGVECEDKSFFKSTNNILTKTSQDVSEFNLQSLLHELMHGCAYSLASANQNEAQVETTNQTKDERLTKVFEEEEKEDDIESDAVRESVNLEQGESTSAERSTGSNLVEQSSGSSHTTQNAGTNASRKSVVNSPDGSATEDRSHDPMETPYRSISLDNAKIYLLPLNCADQLNKKEKYQRLFDIIYVSNSLAHQMTSTLSEIFADGAAVTMDTAKFLLDLTKDQTTAFAEKIIGLAESAGCKVNGEVDKLNDAFIHFTYTRQL